MLDKVIKKNRRTTKKLKETPAFYVGEHLKDILKRCVKCSWITITFLLSLQMHNANG